jgi:arsenite methyltransferase
MSDVTILQTLDKSSGRDPKYGYYFLGPYILMLAVFLVVGYALMAIGQLLASFLLFWLGIATAAYGVLTTIGWALARYVLPGNRVTVARQIIADLHLTGTERVLDVGSGRGLYAIEAAKVLFSGNVVGIDLWDPAAVEKLTFHHQFSQPTGNTIQNAQKNATLAGVSEKARFVNMDAANLDFPDETFDLVTCGFLLSHLWRDQKGVLEELGRVLKTGGRLLIVDNVRDLTYFMLSTPHMFVLSYIRGRKARRLSRLNWLETIRHSGFRISRCQTRRGLIVAECTKGDSQPAQPPKVSTSHQSSPVRNV